MKKGSAILIALLIVALVGVVGFGVARIAIVQIRIANINDSALRAYHAAESGLEYGLLQYKINQNAVLSEEVRNNPSTTKVVKSMGGLPAQNATPLCQNNSTPCQLPPADQSYTLLMYHHRYFIGNQNCFSSPVVGQIISQCENEESPLVSLQYDESYVFSKDVGTEIFLRAEPENLPTTTNSQDITKGAVVVTGYDASGQTVAKSVYNLGNNSRDTILSGGGSNFQLFSTGVVGASYTNAISVSIQYFGPQAGSTENPGTLRFALQTKNGGDVIPFDSGVTSIEVVGKSQGAERRLKALIDRGTNKVLGVFDEAIYAVDRVEVVE